LAAQQILAVVQLRKTHISSVADFLGSTPFNRGE
jgi:hypothetical protein